MTNFEKLKNMTPGEAETMIRRLAGLQAIRYADISGWLESEQDDMIYRGKPGKFVLWGKKVDCIIAEDRDIAGKPYKVVVSEGKVYSAPADSVTEKKT